MSAMRSQETRRKGRNGSGKRAHFLTASVSVGHRSGTQGRRKRKPQTLYADTKCDMLLNRFYLAGKGIRSQVLESLGRKERRGRPRIRLSIERLGASVKSLRRVAVRHWRRPQVYIAFVRLASVGKCLGKMQRVRRDKR